MNKTSLNKIVSISSMGLVILVISCIESIDFRSESYEKVLVVDATITNEYKYHEIKLSKTVRIEEQDYLPEQNATVNIVDGTQNIIVFNETEAGTYVSNQEFKAEANMSYELNIKTNNGISYKTKPINLTSRSQIDDLYAVKEVDAFGNPNVTIYIDSHSLNGDSNFYHYEYEETYKIIPEFWSPKKLVTDGINFFTVDKANFDDRVCYNTSLSTSIIQTQTSEFTEDKVSKFPVISLSTKNPKIGRRYSILVKQFVQSPDGYNYFKLLGGLNPNESIFSQNQPGFVPSNIFSENDDNEKVVGFFEVNSVEERRIFFSYVDFFPNEQRPPYFIDCAPFSIARNGAVSIVQNGELLYWQNFTPDPEAGEIPYLLVTPECGDCRKLGTIIKPTFWVD